MLSNLNFISLEIKKFKDIIIMYSQLTENLYSQNDKMMNVRDSTIEWTVLVLNIEQRKPKTLVMLLHCITIDLLYIIY